MLDGRDVTKCTEDTLAEIRNRYLGFVFQNFNLLPGMSALENVMLPAIYAELSEKERHSRAEKVLSQLGLESRMHHHPHQLSGGQQQRVSIARALINNPRILLADEPTGALDSKTSQDIMQLLRQLNSNGMTIVMVTHDADVALNAKRMIKLKDGRIISDEGVRQAHE